MNEDLKVLCFVYATIGLLGSVGFVHNLWNAIEINERFNKSYDSAARKAHRKTAALCTLLIPVICVIFPVVAALLLLLYLAAAARNLFLIVISDDTRN